MLKRKKNPNKIKNEIIVINETRKMFDSKGIKNESFFSYFIMLVVKSEITQMSTEEYSRFSKLFREKNLMRLLEMSSLRS